MWSFVNVDSSFLVEGGVGVCSFLGFVDSVAEAVLQADNLVAVSVDGAGTGVFRG